MMENPVWEPAFMNIPSTKKEGQSYISLYRNRLFFISF